MGKISALQQFTKEHACADLAIVRCEHIDAYEIVHPEEWAPVAIVWQTRTVAIYTRRRDARRALKDCGYTLEGCFWRIRPAQERPLSPFSIDIGDLVGDL
ncbi:hypothetical protein [Bradyrhizobium sp.]